MKQNSSFLWKTPIKKMKERKREWENKLPGDALRGNCDGVGGRRDCDAWENETLCECGWWWGRLTVVTPLFEETGGKIDSAFIKSPLSAGRMDGSLGDWWSDAVLIGMTLGAEIWRSLDVVRISALVFKRDTSSDGRGPSDPTDMSSGEVTSEWLDWPTASHIPPSFSFSSLFLSPSIWFSSALWNAEWSRWSKSASDCTIDSKSDSKCDGWSEDDNGGGGGTLRVELDE